MNYVLWGLYNGLILAMSALLEPVYKKTNARLGPVVKTKAFYVFRVLRTFLIVNIGWYFDRCLRAGDAFHMLYKTVFSPQLHQLSDGTLSLLGVSASDVRILALATLLLFAVSLLQERGMSIRSRVMSLPVIPRVIMLYAFMYFVLAAFMGAGSSAGFMYAIF